MALTAWRSETDPPILFPPGWGGSAKVGQQKSPLNIKDLVELLAEVGFAYMLQAAVSLASETLRIPPARMRALSGQKNAPCGAFSNLAERVGFAYMLQAAVSLASETLRIPPARMRALSGQKNAPCGAFSNLAERVGFEPTVPCSTPDFESGTFDHSATSPDAVSNLRSAILEVGDCSRVRVDRESTNRILC